MAFGTCHSAERKQSDGVVSILVFLEWPLGLIASTLEALRCLGFNPCFSGMAFGTIKASSPMVAHFSSFNPCFSGMAFGTHTRCAVCRKAEQFQSLFFWNGLWDSTSMASPLLPIPGFNPCFSGMAFGTTSSAAHLSVSPGFNPCFSGMAFGTNCPLVSIARHNLSFNPCFSGMAFGTPPRKKRSRTLSRGFNPCFSGMAFGTQAQDLASPLQYHVSILVFLEWPLGHLQGMYLRPNYEGFQSLFFWNGLWDWSLARRPARTIQCFNPCFSGMAFGTPAERDLGVRRYRRFQSLFFWNGLWDGVSARRADDVGEFQSLFFWNGLWDSRVGGKHARTSGFNPCFSGMAFGTRRPLADGRHDILVSILVFLEWPLGPSDASGPQIVYTEFQSLFFWNGLWDTGRSSDHRPMPSCFNPCFSGMAFGTRPGYPCGIYVRCFNPCFSGMAFGTPCHRA